MTGTTATLMARIDEQGIIYITGEYYEQNKRISEVSDTIRGKSRNWLIDPAARMKLIPKLGALYSICDEYNDNGVYPITAENDVDAGINRVAEYFKRNKIKIFSTCKNLIYELDRYHWSEERETVAGVMKPKPYKSLDHACDCLRYLIMSRPSKATRPEEKIQRGSVAWEMEQEAIQAENWRSKYKG